MTGIIKMILGFERANDFSGGCCKKKGLKQKTQVESIHAATRNSCCSASAGKDRNQSSKSCCGKK